MSQFTRALRTDHRSVGARFDCFDSAQAYAHLQPRDVPPSSMYPEFQVALGPNNAWLDFHVNRAWEYRTAWGESLFPHSRRQRRL